MLETFQIIGIMDSFRGKSGALKHYQQKLHQYQEHEAETLIDIGVIFLEEDHPERALKHFRDALDTYQKLEYPEGEAFTHDLIGDAYLTLRNFPKALQHYKKSLEIYSGLGSSLESDMEDKIEEVKDIEKALLSSSVDMDGYSDYESEKGDIKSPDVTKDDKKVTKPPIDMRAIAEKLEESIMLMDNAKLYVEYYQDSKSTAYLKEALNTAEVIEDYDGQGTLNLMIGDINLKNENTHKALEHFENALSLFEENENEKGKGITYLLIGAVYFILNKKEEMYNVFKDSFNIFKDLGYKDGELMTKSLIELLSS